MNNKKRLVNEDETKPAYRRRRQRRQRVNKAAREEEEERRLTSLLFGGTSHLESDEMPAVVTEKIDPDHEIFDGEVGFEIDRTGVTDLHPDVDEDNDRVGMHKDAEDSDADNNQSGDQPAWYDEDDEKLEVNLYKADRLKKLRTSREEPGADALDGVDFTQRLRDRYQSTMQKTARTDWARIAEDKHSDEEDDHEDDKETKDEDEDSDESFLRVSSRRLPPNLLNVVRCPDANQSDPNNAVVQSVHFHPGSEPDRPLMLTAGLDKTLRFFQVGAEESVKVHGIHCKILLRPFII